MLKKRMMAGVLATACGIAPTFAQTSAPPPQSSPPPDARPGPFITHAHPYVRASRLVGVEVIGADNTRIGETEELLLDSAGKVAGVVIGVGGFLGIGEKRVAVPFDKLLWNYGEVARETAPGSSVTPPSAPGAAPPASASVERMPGAKVGDEVLGAADRNQGAAVNPATGPVTTGAAGQPATTPAIDPGRNPIRAVVLLSRAELENAPALSDGRRDRANAAESSPSAAPSPPRR